ncbi:MULTISPECIES: carbohydrate kinase family protein [Methylomonas]|uniref:carbohydrate kinase family protein n=1 Tax=Methylomonas TaxID=416 RepID=UPI001232DFB8|nr:PfkB family carbohydrate kinase [Methylomonas rhizoryzae]
MNAKTCDVLCIGHASYDLVFSIARHPGADEKLFADGLLSCGGGPAANAAVTVARLGYQAGFAGYLGNDVYGDSHCRELRVEGVDLGLLVRGASPTPLSTILVKPDGKRVLINYKGDTQALPAERIAFAGVQAKVVLCDGHEPHLALAASRALPNVPTLLDAGSLHDGTRLLMDKVDYLLASEKFALQLAGDEGDALTQMAAMAPVAVITLGERGLLWRRGEQTGRMSAPPVHALDSTGAGDAFHGAFAAGLAAGMAWEDLLRFASAAGAYCCTRIGARPGMPNTAQVAALLQSWPAE